MRTSTTSGCDRAGSRIGDPHQPHATVCPGRRGDRDGPLLVTAMSSVVLLSSSMFMHVPPPGCFVPTTLDESVQEV